MNKRNVFLNNIPLAEARKLWRARLAELGCLSGLSVQEIEVDDALARVTAEPVFARRSSPSYNAAAMDGIAVRFLDTTGASESSPVRLAAEQYLNVNTGQALPAGFDAVIMIEDVQPISESAVEILAPVTPWKHVRTIGEDIVATELILPEGHRIRPIDQGAMLATGVDRVKVRQRPRVLVVPTGSELVQPGEPLSPGQIVEFNGRIIAGYLREWGALAVRSPIVPDDYESLKAMVERGVADNDALVINAGASAGARDFTAEVLRELGEVIVHGVNIKPGKPVILAIVNNKPVVGLPGYPVSAVITMRLFLRELICAFQGVEAGEFKGISATLSRPLASKIGVEEFVRVKLGRVGETLMATPSGRGAGAVMSLVQADGIIRVPAGSEGIGAGETVQVELLREIEEIDNTLVFIGSHDNTLDVLTNLLHKQRPVCRLSSAHVGSMGGITAIRRGEAHLAGSHLLDEETGEYNVPFIKRYLAGVPLILVNLAHRQQGFLVLPGNPKGIKGFADLGRADISFVNRQRGAGTRLLTDMHMKIHGLSPAQVKGYGREEYTHMGVASAVVSGAADTGLGIMAAARAMRLDFIPVARERYDLIIPRAHLHDRKVAALLEIISRHSGFREIVEAMGGYDLCDCGKIIYEQ